MLIYPTLLKYDQSYYLYINVKSDDYRGKIKFKIKNGKEILVIKEVDIIKENNHFLFRLNNIQRNCKLYYEKNDKEFYVNNINLYDYLIFDSNEISYKVIEEMKASFLNRIKGMRNYE